MQPRQKSWLQEENEENTIILQAFWKQRVLTGNTKSINDIKNYFLKGSNPIGKTITEWEEELNKAWNDPRTFQDFSIFAKYFAHIPSLTPIATYEKLKIKAVAENQQEITAQIQDYDVQNLKTYLGDRHFDASIYAGSLQKNVVAVNSNQVTSTDIFAIQSVGKVFTGMLTLILMREGIISPQDLKKVGIPLNDEAKRILSKVAPNLLYRLQEVTLHQAMTHQAGLGDYLRAYAQAVEQPDARNIDMNNIAKFLKYANGKLETINEYHYSNTGILIVGLAIAELYKQYRHNHPEKNLPTLNFNGLLKKYILDPAGIEDFYIAMPPEGKYSPDFPVAPYICGSPAGGYWTNADELFKLAKWLYELCNKHETGKPDMPDLLTRYGQEICPKPETKTIEHGGAAPSGGAYFSVNWDNGNVCIVMNSQRATIANTIADKIHRRLYSSQKSSNEMMQSTFGQASNVGKKFRLFDKKPTTTTQEQSEKKSEVLKKR